MHLFASLPIALVLMLKRSCLLASVGNRCLLGRRANEVILCSYPFGACLVQCNYPLDPATHSRKNVNQTRPLYPLFVERKRKLDRYFDHANGELLARVLPPDMSSF